MTFLGLQFIHAAPVTALARSPHTIDLFVTGNDGHVYTSWWHEGSDWSGLHNNWRDIGGTFPPGAPITAIARSPHTIDLFITGNNGHVYTSWWHEGSDWSGLGHNWRDIGGIFPPGAPVSATSRNPGNLDLFITGNDGHVYTSWWYEGSDWSGLGHNWRDIGGSFPREAPVTAIARSPHTIDLFITGNNGHVYTSWWHEGSDWSGLGHNWRDIGGIFPPGAPVSATSRNPGNLDLFITGNDGRVYTSWWHEGSDWSGLGHNWRDIGGYFPPGAPVAAIAKSPHTIDLFITGHDKRVYTEWWREGADWSGLSDNWRPIENEPAISLQAIQVPGSGRFVEVIGTRFTADQPVKLGYDLFVTGAPSAHQIGAVTLASDGTGNFTHRIAVGDSGVSGAQVEAIDVASGAKATANL